MSSKPEVSVIIVTHDSARTVARCVTSVLQGSASVSFEIVVVDTGSSDQTLDVLTASGVPVKLLKVENRGFSFAANLGAAHSRGELLLFLNPDAVLPPGSIARLRSYCRLQGVAAVSGSLVDAHGHPEAAGEPFPSLRWYIRRRLGLRPQATGLRSWLRWNRSGLFPMAQGPVSVPWLSGAALLVRADAFRAVGGFANSFFLYYEDIDLCRRLRQHGHTLLLDQDTRILHSGGASARRGIRLRASDESEDVYFSLYRPPWESVVLRLLRPCMRIHPGVLPLALFAGAFFGFMDIAVPAVAAVAGLAVVMFAARVPDSGALLLLISVLVGQAVRVPFPGVEGGVTLTDVLLPLVLGGWLLAARKRIFSSTTWGSAFLLPLAAILPGLLLASERLTSTEWLGAAGYAARLLLILALIPLGALVLRRRNLVAQTLVGVSVLLSLGGFVQLWLAPSPTLAGFDPHQGRLFSTWLDPNLLGGFLAVALAVLLGITQVRGKRYRAAEGVALFAAGGVTLAALVLTKSRTSLAALLVALLGSALIVRPWRRIVAVVSVGALGLVLVPGLGARFASLASLDPTAQLRVESWRQAAQHIANFPVFGVGYNAYAFEQLAAGNIGTLAIHSRAGADNSLLTFAATTGLWGVGMLGILIISVLWALALKVKTGLTVAAPALLALLTLLAHAQFVHSLVYVHLAVPLALLLGAAFIPRSSRESL